MAEGKISARLFTTVKVGAIDCANRVFMAPLTRCRSTPGTDAPNALNVEYYVQRAGAGLIVSEATQISPQGKGYMGAPGIYTREQEAGWRAITDAVHAKGGKIVAQLWHVGRISHPDLQPGGALPVAPSAINAGLFTTTQNGKMAQVTPRALETHEVAGIVADYRHAAQTAKNAGFDGVEIHAANGYLLEQFLRDSTNRRTDEYGGSIANRLRFTLAAVDAAIEVFGADRVGIRLSPVTLANNCPLDSNTEAVYGALVDQLAARKIAFIHFIEGNTQVEHTKSGFDFAGARQRFGGTYIANNGYTRAMALDAVERGAVDAVAFGRPFLANPDLPKRLLLDAPLNEPNPKTFYKPGAEGYTDYPAL
ncbi:MAG: alkene reductase [Nevskiaceae bacterium]|nr:MAG: alkene reductase [Nevskiaceae bacterium]